MSIKKTALHEVHGKSLLYVAALSFIIADIVPTPADSLYFRHQQKLKSKLAKAEITPKQYWTREALAYYSFNPLYWALLFGVTISLNISVKNKMRLALGLIAAGGVVGAIANNIRKDEAELKLKEQESNG